MRVARGDGRRVDVLRARSFADFRSLQDDGVAGFLPGLPRLARLERPFDFVQGRLGRLSLRALYGYNRFHANEIGQSFAGEDRVDYGRGAAVGTGDGSGNGGGRGGCGDYFFALGARCAAYGD